MFESSGTLPMDRSGSMITQAGDDFTTFAPTQKVFAWVSPNIRYQPLYFEDVALERYGQSRGPYLQSALSGVHMFRSAVWLPYHMLIDRPRECDYPLGFCRPGSEPPMTYQRMWWGLRR